MSGPALPAEPAPRFDPRPVVLEGAHVRLEPLAEAHAPGLFDAGAEDEIWRYLPLPRQTSVEQTLGWINQALARAPESEVPFAIVRRADGRPVGSTRYMDIQRAHRTLEIGWTWLGPAARRTPLNTDCKLLLLHHAFDELGAIRVTLKTDGDNLRSQRAIERIGGVREGVLRRHRRRWDGTWRDTVYYSVIAEEWPAVQERLRGFLAGAAGAAGAAGDGR